MARNPVPRLNPAAALLMKLGGPQAVAAGTGIAPSLVHRWMYPKGEHGGTGGFIPQARIPTIQEFARDRGIDISADDFIPSPSSERAA